MTATTLTAYNGSDIEDVISEALISGHEVTVNGEKIDARWSNLRAVSVCGNGTLRLTVPCRTKRGTTDRYIKVGQQVSIVIS